MRLHLFDGNNASAGMQELKQSISATGPETGPATGFTEVEQSITLPNPKLGNRHAADVPLGNLSW